LAEGEKLGLRGKRRRGDRDNVGGLVAMKMVPETLVTNYW